MGDKDEAKAKANGAIVKLDKTLAVVCLILNIFISGTGSIISSFAGAEFNIMALIFGLIQFFFAWLLCPWCWSIYHGVMLYKMANE